VCSCHNAPISRRSVTLAALGWACGGLGEADVEPAMALDLPADAPRTVALTLDACGGGTDDRIIGTLIRLGVCATIFATELWLHANPAPAAHLRDRPDLFLLQNHGARHLAPVLGRRSIWGVPAAATLDGIRQEVAGGATALTAAGFPAPTWYRGATARYSPAAITLIESMGLRVAAFSRNADAGASLPPATVARRIAAAVSGDVIIAHVNQPHRPSGAGVAAGVAALHAAGTRFVTLNQQPVAPLRCGAPPRQPRVAGVQAPGAS
jgi:peptidoglycan/xylan/chitin deacetylase (PgdA/CDA1 family)